MFFISFGKNRNHGKKPFNPRPSGRKHPDYETHYRKFQGSSQAKTLMGKIKQADKDLAKLDKKSNLHPTDPRYQAELTRHYTKKYTNIIGYWQGFRNYAQSSKANPEVVRNISNYVKKAQDEWKNIKKFLK